MHYYVYISFTGTQAYIGRRSSKLPPNEDKYLGSGKFVRNNKSIKWKWIYGTYESHKDAVVAEANLLNFYNAANCEYFLNQTNSAYGVDTHTKETRLKMSISTKGKKNPNFGKKMSDEQRGKISKARAGKFKGKDNPNYKNRGNKSPLRDTTNYLFINERTKETFLGLQSSFREHYKFQKRRINALAAGERRVYKNWICVCPI